MSGIKSIDKLKSVLDDKYEIVGLIASGGMGEIYLGVHRVLGNKRAIKVIHQEVEKEKDIRKRFIQEARLAASIDHPGIIQIMDFGSHDAFDYLIMPYIEGVTLQDKLDDGVIQWEDAIDMMISMVEAISHAHKKNIIHRDIKPANYMIDAKGQIILTDFGISKNLTDATLTAANTILGSPKFMSPEQITGKKVDNRSDLYSLGLVFYQMLTGINPFDSEEITSVMYKQVHEVPEHPSVINSGIPKRVGDILSRLLEKDPEDRYPNADALLADLHGLKHPETLDAGGETVLQIPRSQRPPKISPRNVPPDQGPGSPVSSVSDKATRIISPFQRKEMKHREKADVKPVSAETTFPEKPKKKKKIIVLTALAGLLLVGLPVLILIFFPGFFKDASQEQAIVAHQSSQKERPEVFVDQSGRQPSETVPTQQESPAGSELAIKVPAIRVKPASITQTLEKDQFVVKTIEIFNDGNAALSGVNIVTESDGASDFLGPVNKRSFTVGAGGTASFNCPINSANMTPGEVKTGRIMIYSSEADKNPKIIEVRLTVKKSAVKETKTEPYQDKITRLTKPEKSMMALRPKKIRESAFMTSFKKLNLSQADGSEIRNILKPAIGFAYSDGIDRQLFASMQAFLSGLSYVQFQKTDPCDILISYDNDGSGGKFVFRSNFYDCGTRCIEVGLDHQGTLPYDALEAIIKRYYCYHALTGLSLINSSSGGAHIDLEIPGKADNILFIDDQVKMCMTPSLDSDCMLLDINREGIYKLFPILEDQKVQQVKGETKCSIDISVSPPAGFEMIAALGVKNGTLISKFRNRFNPESPIVLWPFSSEEKDTAITFCDELFLNLVKESSEKWCINSRFIQIIHKD